MKWAFIFMILLAFPKCKNTDHVNQELDNPDKPTSDKPTSDKPTSEKPTRQNNSEEEDIYLFNHSDAQEKMRLFCKLIKDKKTNLIRKISHYKIDDPFCESKSVLKFSFENGGSELYQIVEGMVLFPKIIVQKYLRELVLEKKYEDFDKILSASSLIKSEESLIPLREALTYPIDLTALRITFEHGFCFYERFNKKALVNVLIVMGEVELIKIMLKKGLDPNKDELVDENSDGDYWTPLDWAWHSPYPEIRSLLLSYNARKRRGGENKAHEDKAHEEIAHEDKHEDKAHEDRAHEDIAREDIAHEDRAHEDKAHEDKAHEDKAHEDKNNPIVQEFMLKYKDFKDSCPKNRAFASKCIEDASSLEKDLRRLAYDPEISTDKFFQNLERDVDLCPNDARKKQPGLCGCGVPDTDSDKDGIPDCLDLCPFDNKKQKPEICGCGIEEQKINISATQELWKAIEDKDEGKAIQKLSLCIDFTDKRSGKSFLMAAVDKNMLEFIEKLGKTNSIDLNEQDEEGRTAFHYAAQHKSLKIAELLTDLGANPLIKNKQDETARDMVRQRYQTWLFSKSPVPRSYEELRFDYTMELMELFYRIRNYKTEDLSDWPSEIIKENLKYRSIQELSDSNSRVIRSGQARVFTNDAYPGLIFKNVDRSQRRRDAESVLKNFKLDRITLPRIYPILGGVAEEFIEKGGIPYIEVYLNFNRYLPKISWLKEALLPAYRQAALFFCETGYRDIRPNNFPFDINGRGIAMIDLEDINKGTKCGNIQFVFSGSIDSQIGIVPPLIKQDFLKIVEDHVGEVFYSFKKDDDAFNSLSDERENLFSYYDLHKFKGAELLNLKDFIIPKVGKDVVEKIQSKFNEKIQDRFKNKVVKNLSDLMENRTFWINGGDLRREILVGRDKARSGAFDIKENEEKILQEMFAAFKFLEENKKIFSVKLLDLVPFFPLTSYDMVNDDLVIQM